MGKLLDNRVCLNILIQVYLGNQSKRNLAKKGIAQRTGTPS